MTSSFRFFLRSTAILPALSAALALLAAPNPARADEPLPEAEVVYGPAAKPPRKLLMGGAILLGASYGTSALVAAGVHTDRALPLLVPLAGPWLAIADMTRQSGVIRSGAEMFGYAAFGVLGLSQAIGAVTVVVALVDPLVSDAATTAPATARVTLTPYVGPGSVGLTGSF